MAYQGKRIQKKKFYLSVVDPQTFQAFQKSTGETDRLARLVSNKVKEAGKEKVYLSGDNPN